MRGEQSRGPDLAGTYQRRGATQRRFDRLASCRTCAAVVGLTLPNRFAEGPATPEPNARSIASAIGCAGTRRPTDCCPPVTNSGTRGDLGKMSVSGPG